MKYTDKLNVFSESIRKFNQDPQKNWQGVVRDPMNRGIKVYRKNYFFLSLKRLQEDYPVTSLHLGNDNFIYFTRAYLLEKGITSENIFDFSKGFASFICSQKEVHQDQLLEAVAAIDLLYLHGEKGSVIKVAKGSLAYWVRVHEQKVQPAIQIDLNESERVICRLRDGARFLSLQKPQTPESIE